jgi:hypothetical protein
MLARTTDERCYAYSIHEGVSYDIVCSCHPSPRMRPPARGTPRTQRRTRRNPAGKGRPRARKRPHASPGVFYYLRTHTNTRTHQQSLTSTSHSTITHQHSHTPTLQHAVLRLAAMAAAARGRGGGVVLPCVRLDGAPAGASICSTYNPCEFWSRIIRIHCARWAHTAMAVAEGPLPNVNTSAGLTRVS